MYIHKKLHTLLNAVVVYDEQNMSIQYIQYHWMLAPIKSFANDMRLTHLVYSRGL